MKVATAGNAMVEVTDLYSTGATVTGVLTSVGSSDVGAACLQDNEITMRPEISNKIKLVLIFINIIGLIALSYLTRRLFRHSHFD